MKRKAIALDEEPDKKKSAVSADATSGAAAESATCSNFDGLDG